MSPNALLDAIEKTILYLNKEGKTDLCSLFTFNKCPAIPNTSNMLNYNMSSSFIKFQL